jgi:hypothetical protein
MESCGNNVSGAFAEILNGKWYPELRLHSINVKLSVVPAYYEG